MLPMDFSITIVDIDTLKSNAMIKAHKEAGMAAMEWFIAKRLHKRFDGSLINDLNYARRDPNYVKGRSLRMRKFTSDHNLFGDTAKAAKRAEPFARSNRKGVHRFGIKIKGLGPQYKRKRVGSNRIDLRSELSRFTSSEVVEFGAIYKRVFIDFLNTDPRARLKTKKKIK